MTRTDTHRGFTLLETLVVVGLVALLAVGIAGIFNTVGETITRGRRVSNLNRAAAQFERVMRADMGRMTREGYLVIRNEYANGGNPVDLFDPARYEGEPNRRPRRIDEVMFFAINETGHFETSRVPMHEDLIARSNEAQIYFGHGKSQIRPIVTNNNASTRRLAYFRPVPEDVNADPFASLGYDGALAPGQVNPNRYASDWALLRHVTPLVSPSRLKSPSGLAEMDIPEIFVTQFGIPRTLLQDSRTQVAMQPAAASLFLHIARQQGTTPGVMNEPPGYRVDARYRKASRGSGVVDTIVTDLAEIRSIVNHAAYDTANVNNPVVYWPEDVDRFGTPFGAFFDPLSPTDRAHMQAWMLDGFPSNRKNENPGEWSERPRIRFEHAPPLFSIEDRYIDSAGDGPRELERAYREADQMMLSASVFAARCTEFIVEWSYGLVDDTPGSPTFGQLLWYGLPRYEDLNGNGVFDAGTDVIQALPFDGVPRDYAVPALVAATGRPESDFAAVTLYPSRSLVNWDLSPPLLTAGATAQTEVSFFGYHDPGPGVLGNGWSTSGSDPDDASWTSAALLDPSDDRPWFWPALIRVTMTIADSTDPTIEATHQMVFEVPQGGLDNE